MCLCVTGIFEVFPWRSHNNTNRVFRLVHPIYDLNTYMFKVNVFTKLAAEAPPDLAADADAGPLSVT